MGMQYRNHI